MSSEHYKKTTTTEPVIGSTKTTTYSTTGQPTHTSTTHTPTTHTYGSTIHEPVDYQSPTTTYQTVHPTGYHQEPAKSHIVDQTDVHGKKWSEEASMVGSDVREGLGKYKDVRPATGATAFDQATGTGPVHETGHTDSSVYRPHDMTDTATKEGSDQREGLGTAANVTTTKVEKDTKHHHKHEHEKHHHKHEHDAATYGTSYSTTTTVGHTTTKHAGIFPAATTTSTTTTYQTDHTGQPSSTFYKYDSTDKTPHYGSSPSRDTTTSSYQSGATHDYSSPSRATGTYEETATKVGSDQREGLGTGAAYGSTTGLHSDTTGIHKTGWSDTANKTGSDVREGLGSGSSYTKTEGKYQ